MPAGVPDLDVGQSHLLDDDVCDLFDAGVSIRADVEDVTRAVVGHRSMTKRVEHPVDALVDQKIRLHLLPVAEHLKLRRIATQLLDEVVDDSVAGATADDVRKAKNPRANSEQVTVRADECLSAELAGTVQGDRKQRPGGFAQRVRLEVAV